MTDTKKILSAAEIADADLTGWKNRGGHIEASFDTGDFATGLRLVNLIGASAEEADHHPTSPSPTGRSTSPCPHDVGGLTVRDVRLARVINDHARGLNLS